MGEFDFLEHLPAVVPALSLTVLAIIVLGMDLYLPKSRRHNTGYVAALGMAIIAIFPFLLAKPDQTEYWGGMVRYDTLTQFFTVTVLLAGSITSLLAINTRSLAKSGEFYLIIIVSTLGATLMSASSDLIMVFIALETTSIPLYILAGFRKNDEKSIESSMKYFLFGSFASAIMLYGFSLLYGFTGQTNLYAIADYLGSNAFAAEPVPVLIAMVFVFAGFGFKISAAPFHFWTPDVYEGAPTPVTAFLSVASKAASFALLMRFFIAVFPDTVVIDGQAMQDFWVTLLAVLSVITMTVGNVLALVQKNIKRLLAYSSIAQAGYTLIGVAAIQASPALEINGIAGPANGVAAVAFYMFMYTFTNLLAFGVIVLFSEATGSDEIADFAGLARRNPWMALAMTIGFLSLAGIPPAAGFFGKFFLFNAAVAAKLEWLAIIGVLNAIIALYYYLVVIKVIYVDRHPDDDGKPIALPMVGAWMLGITSIVVLLLGIIPGEVFNWAVDGAKSLFI